MPKVTNKKNLDRKKTSSIKHPFDRAKVNVIIELEDSYHKK